MKHLNKQFIEHNSGLNPQYIEQHLDAIKKEVNKEWIDTGYILEKIGRLTKFVNDIATDYNTYRETIDRSNNPTTTQPQ